MNYGKFNSIEAFQQRLITLKKQITEFITSLEEAFNVFFQSFNPSSQQACTLRPLAAQLVS